VRSVTTFSLGQLEWALWRWMTQAESSRARLSSIFRTRIRRLLELDRARRRERDETPAARFAFHDAPPHGSGVEVRYTAFNAFCIALGLELLDLGFKQAEIVYLLRHLRARLLDTFEKLQREPLPIGQVSNPDPRVYVVLTRIELTEIVPGRVKPRKLPYIEEPRFCLGIEKLRDELDQGTPEHYRKAVVLELAHTAAAVEENLKQAPQFRRGRR
jgi:hypothetical protein